MTNGQPRGIINISNEREVLIMAVDKVKLTIKTLEAKAKTVGLSEYEKKFLEALKKIA